MITVVLNILLKKEFKLDRKDKDTRQRLLEAACVVFADKGYANATVADICGRAGTNIALVNYYFGDKESLYDCVWRHAFKTAATEFPIGGGLPADADPGLRLRTAIRAILGRIFAESDASFFPRLMLQEMASSSAALTKIAEEAIAPQMQYVHASIRDLLGPDATERLVFDCLTSTMSQCFMHGCKQSIASKIFAEEDPATRDLESMADHIFNFSLGGIRAAKKG